MISVKLSYFGFTFVFRWLEVGEVWKTCTLQLQCLIFTFRAHFKRKKTMECMSIKYGRENCCRPMALFIGSSCEKLLNLRLWLIWTWKINMVEGPDLLLTGAGTIRYGCSLSPWQSGLSSRTGSQLVYCCLCWFKWNEFSLSSGHFKFEFGCWLP